MQGVELPISMGLASVLASTLIAATTVWLGEGLCSCKNAILRLKCYRNSTVSLSEYVPDTLLLSAVREVMYRISNGREIGSGRLF